MTNEIETTTNPVKPAVQLTGTDGNVFALMAECSRALKAVGRPGAAQEMQWRIFNSRSYAEAIQIMREYVDAR